MQLVYIKSGSVNPTKYHSIGCMPAENCNTEKNRSSLSRFTTAITMEAALYVFSINTLQHIPKWRILITLARFSQPLKKFRCFCIDVLSAYTNTAIYLAMTKSLSTFVEEREVTVCGQESRERRERGQQTIWVERSSIT